MSPERDDYLDDDRKAAPGERRRGVLAAGWLRALLVLGALAVLLIVSVPYIIEWVAPSAPLPGPVVRAVPPAEPVKSEKSESVAASTPAPAPAASTAAPEPKAELPAKGDPSKPSTKPESAPKAAVAAKETAPDAVPAKAAAKPQPAAKATPPSPKATAPAVKATVTPTTATGDYWVQVGLFANSDNAERLAKELREEHFAVEIAQTTRGNASASTPVSQHEVVVTGSSVDAVTAALKGTGTAEGVADGVVVRPPRDLKDAVALSRRLAGEGLKVRIRRVTTTAAGGTLYLVRVGGYSTRDAAAAGKRELAAKGVGGFVTQDAVK
jgi:cell division septation protein DedD